MKRLIYAVEAGFLAWILLDFSCLLRGHDSPSESCCVLVNSLLCVLVCACYYVGVCAYTLSSRCSLLADSVPWLWCHLTNFVGYWSNSSSSLILQYRVLCSSLYYLLFCVSCSSLTIFSSVFCDLLLCTVSSSGAAPDNYRVLTAILLWFPLL